MMWSVSVNFERSVIVLDVQIYKTIVMKLKIKRAYEPESAEDGFRIYIDRLWPRGLSHETFHYDMWDKDIAPSSELREWFHADPEGRWEEFKSRYMAELAGNPSLQTLLDAINSHPVVTLLYSSHDEAHNNAIVVADYLRHYTLV